MHLRGLELQQCSIKLSKNSQRVLQQIRQGQISEPPAIVCSITLHRQRVWRSMRVMLYAAAAAVRCSSLRLSALRTNAARRGVALHATTSAARQARRAAALNDASNPYAGKTVADLKELLRARGLPVSGVKTALLERLAASDGGGGAGRVAAATC